MFRIRLLTLIALILAAVPASAFADVPPLPLTEQQFIAPDPGPASTGTDVTPFVDLLRDTLIAALLAVLTAAAGWLSAQVARWTNGRIALDGVARDLQMETYARLAVDKGLAYALQRTGTTIADLQNVQLKSQVLQYAVDFLSSQYPEVVKWIDADQNGVIDWVETHLPVTADAPKATKPRAPKPANPLPAP
jgi:hypothetical protein